MPTSQPLVTCLLTFLIPTIVMAQGATYPPTFAGARAETYKTVGDVELKTWIFQPDGHKANDRRPVAIFFFGGGWKKGSPGQFEQHCRYLASQGMVAMTADYRVRERHETLADKAVADAKSAIRWLRKNADRLGIDPDRILAGGGSAGGHLAACTGVIQGLEDSDEDTNVSSVPNALALFNPAVLLAAHEGLDYLDQETLADIATRTGVAPEAISPIHHVRSGLPPTIIFHGQADPTVPYATVDRYTELATQAGNRCELVGYRGESHGFFNYGKNGSPGECYPATVHRMHQFLQSLGYLNGPPAITVPSSPNVHLRSHFDHSLHAIKHEKEATVAFIGGSITEMEGYRVIVSEMLRKRFPDTNFEFVNAGISSTCSTTGAFRLDRDVLSKNPDLLFVEFAVNDDQDAAHATRECVRGMEGILGQARRHNPQLDIVVTHFVNPPMLEKLQHGETPISSGTHENVARHYGVSTVDLAREVAERISANKLTWKEYGGTHPKRPGNQLAADLVEDLLSTAWSKAGVEPRTENRLAKPLDKNAYFDGQLVNVGEVQIASGWSVEVPDWQNLKGGKRARFLNEKLLCATDVGSEAVFSFKGRGVGMYLLAGPDAGSIEYSIDGGDFRQMDLYHRYSRNLHYPRSVMLDADLEPRQHELRFRNAKSKSGEGTAIRVLSMLVNQR